MTKAPTPTEKSKKQSDNKKHHKTFDYTTIADRLKTVNSANDSHPTGVVKPFTGSQPSHNRNSRVIKRTHI